MLARDSLIYVAAKIVPGALGVAGTSVLTRAFAPAEYGRYGVALILMGFGSSMLFDWIGLAFMRLYEARRHDPAAIPTFVGLFVAVVLGTGGLAGLVWAAGWLPRGQAGLWLAGIGMAWAFSWFELVARFEIADFRPLRYLAMNVGRGVLMLAGAGTALLGGGPVTVAVATIGALLAACGLGRRRALLPRGGRFDTGLAAAAMRFGLPYAASMTLLALSTSGVRALVGGFAGEAALGLYTAAFALSQNVLVMVAAGIGSATYPAAVRAVESGDPAGIRAQLSANATVLLALLAPACLGMALVAPDLAALLVGPGYRTRVAGLMPWMAAASFAGGMRGCYLDHAFQLGRRPGLQVQVAALAALLGVGGCALLVPRLGVTGAAMASAAAMVVSCGHGWMLGRRAFALPLPVRDGAWVMGGCAALAGAVLSVQGLPGRVALGAIGYAAVLLIGDVLDLRTSVVSWPSPGALPVDPAGGKRPQTRTT